VVTSAAAAVDTRTRPPTEGNFFVGREPYPTYVEYLIPTTSTHKTPIILIHGGEHTGAGYVSTPDGRDGWAKYFVGHGWTTYVVDWPEHGRSPMPEEFPTMSLRRIVDDNVELLRRVGRAVILVHSLSGAPGWKLCETVPNEVAAIVGIAPHRQPTYRADMRQSYGVDLLISLAETISPRTSHSGIHAMPRGRLLPMRLCFR